MNPWLVPGEARAMQEIEAREELYERLEEQYEEGYFEEQVRRELDNDPDELVNALWHEVDQATWPRLLDILRTVSPEFAEKLQERVLEQVASER